MQIKSSFYVKNRIYTICVLEKKKFSKFPIGCLPNWSYDSCHFEIAHYRQ